MLNIFVFLFGDQNKVSSMVKGYLILMGIIIISTTMSYILVGLKYVAVAMVFFASLLVMLYVLSVRYKQRNYIGKFSSIIIYYILNTKVTRAKDMVKKNKKHFEACDEIVLLFKNFRPNDAKDFYKEELDRLRLNLNNYNLNFEEEDEVLEPFKKWFTTTEKHFFNNYSNRNPNLIDQVYDNLN
ncbi:hypothetical protein OX284_011720 [Flavobacterium sp. SUN046]|uniref:hypothetical protein n=1 Tax=Flavobacterium sp. SUN046 TaxID=3002440 RepID=UPI002DB95ADC|nr:hypothetical protein [Flavobacterium sp. SUN046]MEC4050101.1 hypothetical protein [Flavobacterium sp. SUN046]